MNRCEEVQERLMLSVVEATEPEVQVHLRSCRQCAGFFDDLCALEDLTRDIASSHQPPTDFGYSVMSSLPRGGWMRSLVGRALIPVLLGATVVVVGFMNSPQEVSSGSAAGDALDSSPAPAEEAVGPDFIDVVIEDPVHGRVIVRVPAVIEIQRTSKPQDFYVHNVSY